MPFFKPSLLAGLILLVTSPIFGQVGIGTSSPSPSAQLEVRSTNKGFLPPSVALQGTNDAQLASPTIASPATGLLVYNSAPAGSGATAVTPGFYYYSGSAWVRLIVPTDNVANVTGLVAVPNGGTGTTTGSITGTGALTFAAGGTNQNVTLTPSGTGNTILNGNVGIGTGMTAPTAGLEILTDGSLLNALRVTSNQAFSSSPDAGIGFRFKFNIAGDYTSGAVISGIKENTTSGNQSGSLRFMTNSAGTIAERMRISSSGNVGIGTTSPVDPLDVRSAISVNEIKFRNLDGGDDTDPYRLRRVRNGNNDHELQLHLNDDPQERLAIYGNSCASPGGCGDYSTLLHHYFRADGYAYHAGWLGIGTTSPAAPLHVASSTNQTISYGWFNSSGNSGTSSNQTNPYSIQADARIRATEFNAVSDARIKTNVLNLNTETQLANLNKLSVVNYSYIDKLVNGSRTKTGFIAQQVEAVNSGFVNQSPDFIPSVFAMAKIATIENGVLTVSTEKPHGFEKGDEVKLFAEGKKETIMIVADVKGPNSFAVKGWTAPTKDIFVYGKKVSDFRAIDFDQITALSVGAIQELSKQVDILKAENADLKKNAVQRAEFENLKSELMLLRDAIKQKQN